MTPRFACTRSTLAAAAIVVASVAFSSHSYAASPAILSTSTVQLGNGSQVAALDERSLPGVVHHYP